MSSWRDRLRRTRHGRGDGGGNTIRLTMVDAATGALIGQSDVEPDQLPASFDLTQQATTMHIGGADWHVQHAEPSDRSGYVASGRLRLMLLRVEVKDLVEILFSLPTITGTLPPVVAGDGADAFDLAEDEYRQREFVAASFRVEIEAEFN